MAEPRPHPRNPKSGVVLIATLISLILVVGLTMIVQSAALANTKVLKRLSAEHSNALNRDALRALIRPLVGEVMINYEETTTLTLDGPPLEIEYNGRTYSVSVLRDATAEASSASQTQPMNVILSIR